MPKPRYKSLIDYMERTGTNHTRLLQMVNAKLAAATRPPISPQLFSMMLRGSRRCSRENAWAFYVVTGVPMEELIRWPRYAETENSESVA